MDFKDILVHIDNTLQCTARLDLAIKLAGKHNARLTGLYVNPHYQSHSDSMNRKVREAEQMFRQRTDGVDIDTEYLSVDLDAVGGSMAQVINYYTHAKDLIIVGQTNPGSDEAGVPADLPEWVIVGSGRPVLVVPYAGTFETIGERVIVGWKAGRASTRAVNDAMPFMLRAEQVCVLSVQTVGSRHMDVINADSDICSHLKRYNINIKREDLMTAGIPVADIMMSYAWENSCDLIVVGAYVQTSRGSLHLGPVDKAFLDRMTVPVLMSY